MSHDLTLRELILKNHRYVLKEKLKCADALKGRSDAKYQTWWKDKCVPVAFRGSGKSRVKTKIGCKYWESVGCFLVYLSCNYELRENAWYLRPWVPWRALLCSLIHSSKPCCQDPAHMSSLRASWTSSIQPNSQLNSTSCSMHSALPKCPHRLFHIFWCVCILILTESKNVGGRISVLWW